MAVDTLPRGPRGHLLFGSLPDFRRDQLEFYARSARDHGDVVPTRFGPRRVVLIYHPGAIEELMVTRSRDFVKSPAVQLLRPLLGAGLLMSEGAVWLRQRRLVQPAFHRQRVAAYGAAMTDIAARHIEGWKDGQVLEIHGEMMAVTQAIVAKTLFDADVSDEGHDIIRASNVLAEDFGNRVKSLVQQLVPSWVPTPANVRSRRAIQRLDQVVFRMIAARRKSGEDRGDLLSMLLHAQDADDGSRMTDRQVRDEVMTLFMAGHETTAVALSWTWLLLAENPHVDAKLAGELLTVLGGRLPTVDDLPKLTYAGHVVAESMRIYPPVFAMGRQAVRPTEIGGYRIAQGMIVAMPIWVVHRDPRWFPEPEAFRPERWDGDQARQLPRFAYFPFGGGPRQCIGNSFATMEAVLLLATIAQRFRLAMVPGQRVTPTPYVTLRPEPGIRVRLEPR